jgi:hypothetical protein
MALAAALLYAVGFALVQVGLSAHGFVLVGGFRVRYLAAGVLWALLTAFPVLLGASVGNATAPRNVRNSQRWPLSRPYWTLGVVLVANVTEIGVLCVLMAEAGYRPLQFVPDLARYCLKAALPVGFAFAIAMRLPDRRVRVGCSILAAVTLLAWSVYAYSPRVQWIIPAGWGGGRGTRALLMLRDGRVIPPGLGLPIGSGPIVLQCLVVDQTSSAYIVAVQARDVANMLIMEVARDEVISATYLPANRALSASSAAPPANQGQAPTQVAPSPGTP